MALFLSQFRGLVIVNARKINNGNGDGREDPGE